MLGLELEIAGLTGILLLPLLLVLPGWALSALVTGPSKWCPVRKGFLSLFLSLTTLSLTSLVLLAAGCFHPRLVFVCQAAIGLLCAIVALTKGVRGKAALGVDAVSLTGVVLGVGFALWGSVELSLGGRDPGTYLASGAVLRAGHGVSFQDTLWQGLTADERAIFTHWDHGIAQRHPGFYLHGADLERVKFEVLPLYPCLQALAMELCGTAGAMRLNTYLSFVSLLALAVLGLELGGPFAGVLAPLLLGVSLPQVYFSRFPCADIAAQVLVLGAVASYTVVRPPSRGAILAGLGFGLALLTHPSIWALVPALIIYGAVWDRTAGRRWLVVALPFALAAALEQILGRWEYVPSRLAKIHIGQGSWSVLAFLVAVGTGAFLLSTRLRRERGSRARLVAAAVVVAFVAWAYILRPEIAKTIRVGGKTLPNWDRFTLRWIAGYISPLVLWLGVADLVRRLVRTRGRGALYPVVLLPHLLVFGYRQMVHPDHPWAARRFLVAVFPLLVLAAALFMARLWKERGRIGQLGAALAAGGALLWITTVCRPVLGLHEARSSTEMLHSLSTRIEGTDVVVVEGSRVGYLVAVPLQYLFGKHVLLYKLQRIGDAFVLDRAAKRWAGEGRKVFYLSPWQAGPSPVGEMGLQAIDRFTLTITRPRESWTSPPRGRESLTLPLYLHRFAAAGDPRPSSYAEVNLGEDDFGRVEGFYGPEFAPGSAEGYRWSGRRAKILFPPLSSSGPLRLTLRVSAPRGRGGSPLLRLFVSEEPVAELYPGPDWAVHEVEVPRADPLRAMLRMDSDSWNPLHEGFSDDDRYLGVRVDWARLEVSE